MKIETFLPIFSGFYGTIWEDIADEQDEVGHINEQREELGLEPVGFYDLVFNYKDFHKQVAKEIVGVVQDKMKDFVRKIEFQAVISPKFYNFENDSINVVIEPKVREIKKYLKENSEVFAEYLKERYTSYSGFSSFYPNTIQEFCTEKYLEDKHKLGSVLHFIADNEDIDEEDLYDHVVGNVSLSCENYDELTKI